MLGRRLCPRSMASVGAPLQAVRTGRSPRPRTSLFASSISVGIGGEANHTAHVSAAEPSPARPCAPPAVHAASVARAIENSATVAAGSSAGSGSVVARSVPSTEPRLGSCAPRTLHARRRRTARVTVVLELKSSRLCLERTEPEIDDSLCRRPARRSWQSPPRTGQRRSGTSSFRARPA